jgi:hemolysin III
MAGAILSVVGLIVLLWAAHGRVRYLVAFGIYGSTLVALYTASSLYHSLHTGPRGLALLQRLDFSAIYLLIAGTYTPVCRLSLNNAWGRTMHVIEWSMAVIGLLTTLCTRRGPPNWLRVVLYLGMGWLSVTALGSLRAALPPAAIGWLFAGGLFYTVGTIFYAADRPNLWPGRFTAHDLWHVFVLAGSVSHFILILCFIAHAA